MKLLLSCVAAAIFAASTPANAVLIAYWDQNSNALPTTGFGFTPASFPQAADQGAGSLSLADFDTTIDENSLDGAYDFIESFTGTTDNAQPDVASGGSLSPQGGTDTDGVFSNNGMSILLSVSTSGFEDITISWSQRGTSTGFQSRELLYSTNGVDFTSFGSDTGILGSSFATISYDLSAVSAIEDASSVTFAIKLDGAIGSTGNNRFDNITIEGTEVGIGPGGTIGDYNDDGFVDAADYTTWRDNLGQDGSALANRDEFQVGLPVDDFDYEFWKGQFGQPAVGGVIGGGAVPEPATLFASLLAGLTLVGFRKRIAR